MIRYDKIRCIYLCVYCSLHEDGPWQEVIDQTLVDGTNQENPLPLQTFYFNSVTARYVKFYVMSWYYWGGGLQYFNVKSFTEGRSI